MVLGDVSRRDVGPAVAAEVARGVRGVAELGREGPGAEGEHEPRDALDGSQEGAREAVAGERDNTADRLVSDVVAPSQSAEKERERKVTTRPTD